MCQYVVGTENHVKTIRLMNTVCDNLSSDDIKVIITSGSFGEGLQMIGSDLDLMFVLKDVEVHNSRTPIVFSRSKTNFSMMTEGSKPGFPMLQLNGSPHPLFCKQCRMDNYLSNVLFKQTFLNELGPFVHGPCISDIHGRYDMAPSLHNLTKDVSVSLYQYLCQNIVGTENHVNTIRLMHTVRDNLSSVGKTVNITGGSFGEGLDMRGSDMDNMYVLKCVNILENITSALVNPSKKYLLAKTEDIKPGFAMLCLIKILQTNALLSEEFTRASCEVQMYEKYRTDEKPLARIYAAGSIFRNGIFILKKFLDPHPQVPEDEKQMEALKKLLKYLLQDHDIALVESETCDEAEWAVIVAASIVITSDRRWKLQKRRFI
ncbi:unnamed protein product [Mytilus coruscus]|uniref:Uncharacterized protein n=1 Tax=Mytilus coruscus TaxID=42192 RepID=A0A6J8F0D9_MYTCO|nr:unnamed protein product [Mytilus coruscus]